MYKKYMHACQYLNNRLITTLTLINLKMSKQTRFAQCKRGQSTRYHRYYVDGYDKFGRGRLENRTRRYVFFHRERKGAK